MVAKLQRLASRALGVGSRAAFVARRTSHQLRRQAAAIGLSASEPHRARSDGRRPVRAPVADPATPRRRNILFITVDQQRYDALGVNGGRVANTPALDALARAGINYRRAHVHNVTCMPSRSTMITGQHPRTHGVVANGIPLPADAPSVVRYLRREAGYRTALIGKAHFEPHLDPTLRFGENRLAAERSVGPWRDFDRVELATHGPLGGHHYAAWLWERAPRDVFGFAGVLTGAGGGATGAPEVAENPIRRERYHTDWIAERAIAWLDALEADAPWLCWISFPDPHHPFDPPHDEVIRRVDWRGLALPAGHPGSPERIEQLLARRPRHWLDWYRGRFRNPEGGPVAFVPARLTADQLREINAMIHVENELIDEACGRVLAHLRERGLDERTDVFYTSDHGELQGDYGLLFKGPYHVESLMRVPLIWRPAAVADVAPCEIDEPVGHVDLAPSFCRAAGLEVPGWMQGASLPLRPGSSRRSVITTYDSQFAAVGMHLRTIYRDGYLCTVYEPRTHGEGGRFPLYWALWGRSTRVPDYDGSEGELYNCAADPHQFENLWNDPAHRALRDELIAELYAELPPARTVPLRVVAPT